MNNSRCIKEPLDERFGHILHSGIIEISEGEKQGIPKGSSLWRTNDLQVLLNENTSSVFYVNGDVRIMDRITTLKAVNGDVVFCDNKEGMFAVKVARQLELPADKAAIYFDSNGVPVRVEKAENIGVSGSYLSNEGVMDNEVWGTRARWDVVRRCSKRKSYPDNHRPSRQYCLSRVLAYKRVWAIGSKSTCT